MKPEFLQLDFFFRRRERGKWFLLMMEETFADFGEILFCSLLSYREQVGNVFGAIERPLLTHLKIDVRIIFPKQKLER